MSDGVYFEGTISKHANSVETHYADYGPELVGVLSAVTVSSATATCVADSALTIGTPVVLSGSTIVPTRSGTRTIAANQGIRFLLTAGTAIAESEDPVSIKVTASMSNGETWVRLARLRVSS